MSKGGDRSAVHVGPGRGVGNGFGRRAAGVLRRGGLVVLLGASTAACSLSFPIAGFKTDEAATGSIDRSAGLLSPALDREDWRRARAALAVTLDPQGNGARAAWQNPQSGSRGSFTAVGPPFPDHDRVCRRFSGDLVAGTVQEKRVSGAACRDDAGDWALRDDVDARSS